MRYKIVFSYDGSCFHGLERQHGLKTIQGTLEAILTDINDQKFVSVVCSGRTDKGVHAIGQVAHFDLHVHVKAYNLRKALNKRLDGEIYITSLEVVDDSFHARYDVKEKTYSYYIDTKEYTPILRHYVLQLGHPLDIEAMRAASFIFLGEHDFRSLCFQNKEKINCVRTIYHIDIVDMHGIIKITVTGNGFLRKMVRNIVSILIKVGEGKMMNTEILDLLDKKSKNYSIKCVDACGLYLDNVFYGDADEL